MRQAAEAWAGKAQRVAKRPRRCKWGKEDEEGEEEMARRVKREVTEPAGSPCASLSRTETCRRLHRRRLAYTDKAEPAASRAAPATYDRCPKCSLPNIV